MTTKPETGEAADAIVAGIFADLRDRKLIKWLFTDDPESHGAIGYVDGPIDRETQEEIADAWRKIVIARLSTPTPRNAG